MSKHTPGPWSIHWGSSGNRCLEIHHEKTIVAHATDYSIDGAERSANARLIAAAPELLAALEDSERIISFALNNGMIMGRQHKHDAESHLDGIRAAIAKARGEQS